MKVFLLATALTPASAYLLNWNPLSWLGNLQKNNNGGGWNNGNNNGGGWNNGNNNGGGWNNGNNNGGGWNKPTTRNPWNPVPVPTQCDQWGGCNPTPTPSKATPSPPTPFTCEQHCPVGCANVARRECKFGADALSWCQSQPSTNGWKWCGPTPAPPTTSAPPAPSTTAAPSTTVVPPTTAVPSTTAVPTTTETPSTTTATPTTSAPPSTTGIPDTTVPPPTSAPTPTTTDPTSTTPVVTTTSPPPTDSPSYTTKSPSPTQPYRCDVNCPLGCMHPTKRECKAGVKIFGECQVHAAAGWVWCGTTTRPPAPTYATRAPSPSKW